MLQGQSRTLIAFCAISIIFAGSLLQACSQTPASSEKRTGYFQSADMKYNPAKKTLRVNVVFNQEQEIHNFIVYINDDGVPGADFAIYINGASFEVNGERGRGSYSVKKFDGTAQVRRDFSTFEFPLSALDHPEDAIDTLGYWVVSLEPLDAIGYPGTESLDGILSIDY